MAHLNRKIGIPSFDMTGKTAIITGATDIDGAMQLVADWQASIG